MLRFFNILSIDVAAGAVICCAFFMQIFSATLLPHAFNALGLTVWIIYTTDHLIDAHRISAGGFRASTERHQYHQKHFNTLLILVVVASFIVGLEVFFLSKPILYAGIGIALLVLGYMLAHRRLKLAKEFVGAVLYTAGVIIAPLSMIHRTLETKEWVFIGLFTMTAFTNLLLFSWYGRKSDEQDDHPSFATTFGEKTTMVFIGVMFGIIAITSVWLLYATPLAGPTLTLISMNAILLLIFAFKRYFATDDRYRRLGDSVFLIPLIYVLLFT